MAIRRNSKEEEKKAMNIREILDNATEADKKALKDFLAEETKKEGWARKTVRVGAPIIGTVLVAGAVVYVGTRGLRKEVKNLRSDMNAIGNSLLAIEDGTVTSMGKTGTR